MILYIINNIITEGRYVINNRHNIMHILPSLQFYGSGVNTQEPQKRIP